MRGPRIQKPPESFKPPPLPLSQCLAKSRKADEGAVLAGRLVLSHCQIVGEVARAMMSRMPDWLRTGLFPDGCELIAGATPVGVFPRHCGPSWSRTSLPHARGGVSEDHRADRTSRLSSPRPWGCFSGQGP